MRQRLNAGLLAALLACGCGGQVAQLHSQGQVVLTSGASGTGLVFAQLDSTAGAQPALVLPLPSTGQLDVIQSPDGHTWNEVGQFFTIAPPLEVVPGMLSGRGVVFARTQGGSIELHANGTDDPNRLSDPVQIYRRSHNGQVIDNLPPALAMAAGDLDGDGSDEVAVATLQGIIILENVSQALGANPEVPPAIGGVRVNAGPSPTSVAIVDVDGDGRNDLVEVDGQEATARIYLNRGPTINDILMPQLIQLAQPAQRVVAAAGCASAPAALLEKDGSLQSLSPTQAQPRLPQLTPILQLAATPGLLALVSQAAVGVSLTDACAADGVLANVQLPTIAAVALESSTPAADKHLAVLDQDGKTVRLFSITPPAM